MNDQQLAKENLTQTEQYVPAAILNIQEQTKLGLFTSNEEYEKVGSTVDEPVLDDTNILYNEEGVDQQMLFNVLTLHDKSKQESITRIRTQDTLKRITPAEKPEAFKVMDNELGNMNEKRAQTNKGNFILGSTDKEGDIESLATLLDMVEDKAKDKSMKLRAKQQEVEKRIMKNLSTTWKEYHYRINEKKTALGDSYMNCEKNIKKCFVKIKFLEGLKQRMESQLATLNFKHNVAPQMDRLLKKYVERQQRMIARGLDPEITFTEAIAKSKPHFNKYIKQYEDFISNSKS